MVFCCCYSCCVCDCGMRQRRREKRLLRAAKKADVSDLGLLIIEMRVNPNCRYFMSGKSAIHLAAERGHVEFIDLIVQYGGKVEKKDRTGKTALHWAAIHGHVGVCKMLLEKHAADIDQVTDLRRTPLHLAALHGQTAIVKYLLEMDAEILATDQKQWTTQTFAFEGGHKELFDFLHNIETRILVDRGVLQKIPDPEL